MSYIDVHCHLDLHTYGDLSSLIEKCGESGVDKIMTVGFDLPSSRLAASLAERYAGVYFTAGFHPTELKEYGAVKLNEIAALCAHKKCVAVGEIGLDYHYPDTQKQLQKDAFIAQLELAASLKLPVQIHSRDCAEDMLKILKEHKNLLVNGALMHCYSHSVEIAVELEKLGFYFSFGGAATWKGSKRANRVIAALSADRILTETDSPYMPPLSAYGSFPNTPLAIPEICAHMAEIKGVPAETMREKVNCNARALFKKLG